MTAAEADKLRAMCEQVILRRCTSWNGFLNDTAEIARALLELLPAEGERELRKRGDDAEPRVQARLAAYLEAEHKPIHQDGPSRSMPLVRQPGGEGPGWRPIENAPKDGTEVLISNAVEGAVVWIGRYVPVEDREPDMPQHDGWWNCSRWKDGDRRGMIPTHYQPLPAPPSAASRAPAVREDG